MQFEDVSIEELARELKESGERIVPLDYGQMLLDSLQLDFARAFPESIPANRIAFSSGAGACQIIEQNFKSADSTGNI